MCHSRVPRGTVSQTNGSGQSTAWRGPANAGGKGFPVNTGGQISPPPDGALTLASVLAVFRRRRGLLLWPIAVLLAVALLASCFATRRYRATVEIQVQKQSGGAFGLESTVGGADSAGSTTDSLDYNMTLQTTAGVLRSPALAVVVIEAAHLEETPEYFAPTTETAAWHIAWPWSAKLEPLNVPLTRAPNRRYAAEKIFKSRLKVEPLAGTRLIDISYLDRDPARAARVANTIERVLADMLFQQRLTATLQGSSWLGGQLDELRSRAAEAEARAVALERGSGIFGADASRNVVLERLDSLNQTLTAAESNRILKQSIDQVAQSGSPEMISSLSGNSSTGSVASINNSLTLIQQLRAREAAVRAELAEGSVRYGPAYPKIAELQAELANISSSLAAETTRLGQRAHTDAEIAVREEEGARAAFEEQKRLATEQNSAVIAYQLAKQEADGSRALYEGLLAKLKQASVLEGLHAGNIALVSAAEAPPLNRPASPNMPLRVAVALAAGLMVGLGSAAWKELTDESIQSPAELEAMLGAPLLAVLASSKALVPARKRPQRLGAGDLALLPALHSPVPLPMLEQKLSPFSENLRSLRTALETLPGSALPRVVLVTSSLPGEGRTTVAVNLAASLAQSGVKVLLVDADLRRPMLHFYAQQSLPQGLATALSGPEDVPVQILSPSLPKLDILCGSEIPPLPSELIGSPRFSELVERWREEYEAVIFDSPAVLPATDAVLIGRHADAVLLVARSRKTPQQAFRRGLEALRQGSSRTVPIGIVMNDVPIDSSGFREYFGYGGRVYANETA